MPIMPPTSKRKAPSIDQGEEILLSKRRKKPTACRPCHTRKIKCPGGEPCANCQQSQCPDECTYPVRDQKVTVLNSYIENLLAENQRLREAGGIRSDPDRNDDTNVANREAAKGSNLQRDSARNPLLDNGSWFVPHSTSEMPGLVGEAADTAFATRFRQAMVNDHNIQHMPRTHYVFDSTLASLADAECPWPPVSRARLLVKTAIDTVGSCYHCVRRSEVFKSLKQHYCSPLSPDSVLSCRLWALFALGEVYSARTMPMSDGDFPGLAYFARASRVLRNLRERPQIETIEVLLLLSLYSLLMNRRYNASFLASTAVRVGIIMGMHQDMPEVNFPDRAAREHRARLWWTTYVLDRMWASKMGHPVSIQDEDIAADLPSCAGLSDVDSSDFLDADYVNASIKLAQISRDIIASIYNRKAAHIAFSRRVQKALSDLRGWVSALPKHLQIETGDTARPLLRRVQWLHLSFNQLVIIATRPILLHIFQTHQALWFGSIQGTELRQEIGETAIALAEACIRCARHSQRLLMESWIDGSFYIFDYTYTQYLFSSAIVLAISSLSIGKADQEDKDGFDSSCQYLDQLRRVGNFAATEFCRHLEAVRLDMAAFLSKNGKGEESPEGSTVANLLSTSTYPSQFIPTDAITAHHGGLQPTMTAEMALAEPLLQDFLTQADLDLNFLDTQMQDTQFQSLYVPANFQDGI
ncbi:fungal-specific transcription factor domain-containing protein [Biscogniauxia mediterranea]|nr:fungal-specific transcription factor domain-containing protein [Biscogniauxia mediterranea]